MIQHKSPISGVASFETLWIATAGYDNQLILWNAQTRKAVARALHDHLVNACSFSKDGKWLLSASSDHTARVYRMPDLKLSGVCAGHDDDVEMAVFNDDSTLIATASRDRKVRVFDLNGKLLAEMIGHEADVSSVAFASDGSLISTSDDGTIRKWSIDGTLLSTIDLDGVETDSLIVTASGLIVAGNDNGQIVIANGESLQHIESHEAGIKRLVWNETSQRLVSVSYDRSCKVWTLNQANQFMLQSAFSLPNQIWPRAVTLFGEDEVVFGTFGTTYASYSLTKNIWNLEQVNDTPGVNAVLASEKDRYTIGDAGILRLNGQLVQGVGSLCNFLLSCGERVLTGGQSGQVFDASTGSVIHTHSSPLNCGASFTYRGTSYAAIGTYTGEILIFADRGSATPEFVKAVSVHMNAVKGVAANDSVLFSVSANCEAACMKIDEIFDDVASTKWVARSGHQKIANGCCHVDGNLFASISRDLSLRIWDATAGVTETYPSPHTHSIKCVASHSTGRYIATGSYNGMVLIFDRTSEAWLPAMRPTASGVSSICATEQGFVAASYDGNTYEISI